MLRRVTVYGYGKEFDGRVVTARVLPGGASFLQEKVGGAIGTELSGTWAGQSVKREG